MKRRRLNQEERRQIHYYKPTSCELCKYMKKEIKMKTAHDKDPDFYTCSLSKSSQYGGTKALFIGCPIGKSRAY